MFGGDICQIILVIIKGSKGKKLATSFWRSFLWHGIGILKLQQNMHLAKTSSIIWHYKFVLFKVESGHILINENGNRLFPQPMIHAPNLLSFIQVVYNNIQNINSHYMNEYFKYQIILSTFITLSTISIITSSTFILKFFKHFSMQTLSQNMGVVH